MKFRLVTTGKSYGEQTSMSITAFDEQCMSCASPEELSQYNKPETGSGRREEGPWILQEWRRTSIPEWQRILQEARTAGNQTLAIYAAWMLSDILEAWDG